MTSPVRFADGALHLLDQTRLPAEERWLECTTPDEVADAIRRLAVRGAPAIGVAAAYGLALGMRMADRDEPPLERFERDADLLAGTRPTAVNLRWAIERARLAAEEHASAGPEAVAGALEVVADTIAHEQLHADRRMADLGAGLLGEGDRVLTHCNTGALATGGAGTAGGVIARAWEWGRLAHVWVDETRPLLQGARLTAWELARAGIPFRLVTDASVGALMSRGLVDSVIVGADRIARNGDVANKIGTYTVAVLASRHEVPFYVAAPLSTIDAATATGDEIAIEERDPSEVTRLADRPIAPEGTPAANFAFDVTPAELVAAIVTERGVLRPPYGESIGRALAT
ncbi:MAG TPA: S-methyl-5-thioribose-1-phosphate isomerase [Thermoleophilaceae bacterium]|nr:S-methyl-5-thioribose-1-phosphate isomerase [Thermoleophilaceae bacterium]